MAKTTIPATVVLSLLCMVCGAQAQQSVAGPPRLSLVPAVVSIAATFGRTVRETVTLNNQTESAFPFSMAAEDVITRNGKRFFVPAGETPNSIAASAVFSQRSGYIEALSEKSVQVLLTVPGQTKVRGVVVFFRGRQVQVQSGSVKLNASLGSLITFTLSGDTALAAQPIQIRPSTASENLRVTDVVTNIGTEPVVLDGVAALVDANGSLIARIPFSTVRYMPGERLKMAADYAGSVRPGKYRVICTFTYAGKTLTRMAGFTSK